MKLHKLFISFLCCACVFANAAALPINRGMSFEIARKVLIQNGWKPNQTHSGEFGVERLIKEKGFVEIESCTMGVQYCSFNYTKNNTCLGVATVGEELENMRIYSWNFECPEAD